MDMLVYLALGIVVFGLGYVARKYVEKKWPDEAAMIDAVATKYGEDRAAQFRAFLASSRISKL